MREIMSPEKADTLTRLRLRTIYPITDNDGSCSLLYDLERTFILQVPKEFQQHIAFSLKSGQRGETLTRWLVGEDLLTTQERRNHVQGTFSTIPQVTDISLDLPGSCNLGCSYCFENDIGSRIGPMSEETALKTVEFVFKKASATHKIVFHFGSGEPLIRFDLLQKVVAEADRRAQTSGQQITYELTTNATLVTEEIASYLKDHNFNVRVSCDGPPFLHNKYRPFRGGQGSYLAVEKGLNLLLKYLPQRLTVNSVLSSGGRLYELWAWAKKIGVRRYHVIKVGAYGDREINLQETDLVHFRADLEVICEDLFLELKKGCVPIDYQPIIKIVRRLMIPEPITRFCGVAGSYLGIASNGDIYPCFRHLGLAEYHLGDIWHGVDDKKRGDFISQEAADVDSRPICQECWARYLCGGGCYADSTIYGPDKRNPQVEQCPFWRTEIEIAIRFYQRLCSTDPRFCLRLFGEEPAAILDFSGGNPAFLQRRNCS